MATEAAVGTTTPLEQLVRDFLVHCRSRRLSSKTVEETYRPRLERQFLPWCTAEGITHIRQVDKRALERYQAHLFEEGSHLKRELSTFTVNSYVRTVNVFLAWAREEGRDHHRERPPGPGTQPGRGDPDAGGDRRHGEGGQPSGRPHRPLAS